MSRPELSLVIPVFNEEEDLSQVDARLKELLQRLAVDAEVVFVDDGSRDRTMDTLLRFAGHDTRYRVLSLSRRFGRESAIAAGLDRARGRAIIVTDSELQPPEVFLEAIEKWKAGFDVVFGKRRSRAGEGGGAGGASGASGGSGGLLGSLFASLMSIAVPGTPGIDVPLEEGDFRLLSRRAASALRALRETHRSPRGLVAWAGFRQTTVEFERLAPEKTVGFGELLGRAIAGVGAFSTRPLRLASWAGALLGVCSIVYGIVAVAVGLGASAAVVPLLFSVQFLLIGILGEYVGRIYEQVKRRPLYVVAQRIGFGSKKRAEKLVTRDLEEVPSFPRTPSVPPALPLRASKPPSLSKTPAAPAASAAAPPAPPPPPRPGSMTSEVPPPPPAVVAAGAAAEASISQPRQRAASLSGERTSVTPAAPAVGSARPPPLKLSSSLGAIPAAPPAPAIPERASTPPVAPRRPSFASIPHPAAVPTPSAPPVLGASRASRPPSLPRTPSAPPVAAPRTPSAPPVAAPRTPSAPPVSTRSAPPRPGSSPPSVSRTPSAPPIRPSVPRAEIAPTTTRSPSNAPPAVAPPPANDDKKG